MKLLRIKFDQNVVNKWYSRDDVYNLILISTKYKYMTFMKYKNDGTSYPPARFKTLGFKRTGYEWILKFHKVGTHPVSIYRDVDNWKYMQHFHNHYKKYKEEREIFFKDKHYRCKQTNPDFVIDIDGYDMYESWEVAYKVCNLYREFNIMFFIVPSGKKGWQIVVPGFKSIKREYFESGGKEYNNHLCLLVNIKAYLNLGKEVDESSCDDLRFVKQPFSLDGRNMIPIVPLTWDEFLDFKNYADKPYMNPYVRVSHWDNVDLFRRGHCWQGKNNMQELDKFLDGWIDENDG